MRRNCRCARWMHFCQTCETLPAPVLAPVVRGVAAVVIVQSLRHRESRLVVDLRTCGHFSMLHVCHPNSYLELHVGHVRSCTLRVPYDPDSWNGHRILLCSSRPPGLTCKRTSDIALQPRWPFLRRGASSALCSMSV